MMNITREDVSPLNTKVRINLSNEDYKTRINDSLKKLSKKVDLKGFRKGMVPVNLVKKLYGNQVLAEELNQLVNDELGKYIKENNLDILGSPIPEEDQSQSLDINQSKDYEFVYELGLSPQFQLEVISPRTKITRYKIKIDDKLLEKEINRLRKQGGKMTNPEDAVREEDVIYVELSELDENGNVKEGGITNSTAIGVDMLSDTKLVKQVTGLKIGESLDFDLFKSMDRSREEIAKHFLNVEKELPESVGSNFKMTLKKINRVEPAEMNQELFDKVFGKDVVKSEEEFRAKLKEELNKAFERETHARLHHDLRNYILDNTPIDLPDDFLKRWIRLTNEKPISTEEVENEYGHFARNLKWSLIVNRIKKDHQLEVKQEDLKEHTKQAIKDQFGLSDDMVSPEQLETWSNSLMGNKEHLEKTYDQLMGEKLFNFIESQITIDPKEVSVEEFNELN